jgi:hypothetical protein
MSFYKSAYDTTLGSSMSTNQIEKALKEAIVREGIDVVSLGLITSMDYRPLFVTGLYDAESNIPLFGHPFLITQYNRHNYLCTDLRGYVRAPRGEESITATNIQSLITNRTGYQFTWYRTVLQLLWVTGHENQIRTNLAFAGTVFAMWLSEVITKAYALDPKDQLWLQVITHFYYQTLFSHDDHFFDEHLQLMAMQTTKAIKAPANLVFEIFDQIKEMASIVDYCRTVQNVLENIRLKDFDEAGLINLIDKSWFERGMSAKELLAMALEHPPTWATIVYFALTDRSYKHSLIARVADRFGRGQLGDQYIKAFESLLEMAMAPPGDEGLYFKPF